MEQFAWLGDGISDAAKRLLKKTLSLPSCASPGTTSPETRRAGSSVGPEGSAPWPEVKDQTDGLGTLWLGCPVLGLAQTHCPPPHPPGHSAAPSCQQRDKPTHARPHGLAADTHDVTAHAHTHICAHACARTSSSPSLLPRGCSGHAGASFLYPSIHHRPSPLPSGSSAEAGKALDPRRRLCLPHCPRLSPLSSPGRAPSRLGRETGETPKESRARTTSHHCNATRQCRGAGAGEAPWPGRKQLSSDPPPRGNRPETRVNRKAKKSPGEGDLPVGGRGRLEDRGESEEACLSWRQGGSPS